MHRPHGFFLVLPLLVLLASSARAGDEAFVGLADQLIERSGAALDAARPEKDQRPRPPRFKNLRLRKNLKDIRALAVTFRDRAASGNARSMLGKGTLWRLKKNLRTANHIVMTGGAFGMPEFPAAFEQVRESVKALQSEMCCGEDA